jgi:hypothetical protein
MSEAMMPEKGATVPMFYSEPVENTFRSKAEGRACFDEVEFVKLIIPGDRNNCPVKRVDDDDRQRWPKQYQAFKDGLEPPLDGTPLAGWPPINKSQVLELAFFHIKTVEQLAGVHDGQLQNLPMGSRELRSQAIAYIEVAKHGTAPLAVLVKRADEAEADNALLRQQMADMAERLDAMEKKRNARATA